MQSRRVQTIRYIYYAEWILNTKKNIIIIKKLRYTISTTFILFEIKNEDYVFEYLSLLKKTFFFFFVSHVLFELSVATYYGFDVDCSVKKNRIINIFSHRYIKNIVTSISFSIAITN